MIRLKINHASKDMVANPTHFGSGELVPLSDNKVTRRTYLHPSVSPFSAIPNDEFNLSAIGEQTNTVDRGDQKRNHSLRFYVDPKAWDVLYEEQMDWRDTSWSSMHLPGNRMCKISVCS